MTSLEGMSHRRSGELGEVKIDLGLYTQVIRQHRRLVTVGVAITVVLAVLSYVRISTDGIGYRSSEVWSNEATLVLSQPGFPEWRSTLPAGAELNTQRLASLVDLYAALATSESMRAALLKRGLINQDDLTTDGQLPISASAVPATVTGASTPLMKITGRGPSATAATNLTIGATATFISVLRSRQQAADIPPKNRVEVRAVKRSGEPVLVKPRNKSSLIVLLLAGLTATIAAAFVRENLQRRADHETGEGRMTVVRDNGRWTSEQAATEPDSAIERSSSASANGEEHPADEERKIPAAERTRWAPRSSR